MKSIVLLGDFNPTSKTHMATNAAVEHSCAALSIDVEGIGIATPLRITGSDAEGEVRVSELPGHPFFLGTLFVPQARSTPGQPHPLINAFLSVVAGHEGRRLQH